MGRKLWKPDDIPGFIVDRFAFLLANKNERDGLESELRKIVGYQRNDSVDLAKLLHFLKGIKATHSLSTRDSKWFKELSLWIDRRSKLLLDIDDLRNRLERHYGELADVKIRIPLRNQFRTEIDSSKYKNTPLINPPAISRVLTAIEKLQTAVRQDPSFSKDVPTRNRGRQKKPYLQYEGQLKAVNVPRESRKELLRLIGVV